MYIYIYLKGSIPNKTFCSGIPDFNIDYFSFWSQVKNGFVIGVFSHNMLDFAIYAVRNCSRQKLKQVVYYFTSLILLFLDVILQDDWHLVVVLLQHCHCQHAHTHHHEPQHNQVRQGQWSWYIMYSVYTLSHRTP